MGNGKQKIETEKERTMKRKQKDTKKKPFWKNLLITKKTVEQDPTIKIFNG